MNLSEKNGKNDFKVPFRKTILSRSKIQTIQRLKKTTCNKGVVCQKINSNKRKHSSTEDSSSNSSSRNKMQRQSQSSNKRTEMHSVASSNKENLAPYLKYFKIDLELMDQVDQLIRECEQEDF